MFLIGTYSGMHQQIKYSKWIWSVWFYRFWHL